MQVTLKRTDNNNNLQVRNTIWSFYSCFKVKKHILSHRVAEYTFIHLLSEDLRAAHLL